MLDLPRLFAGLHPKLWRAVGSYPFKAWVLHHMPVSFMKARQNDLPEQSAGLHPAMGVLVSRNRIYRSDDRRKLLANPRQHLFLEPADHRYFLRPCSGFYDRSDKPQGL